MAYHWPRLADMATQGTSKNKSRMRVVGVSNEVFSIIYQWLYGQLIDVRPWRRNAKQLLKKIGHKADQMGFTGMSVRIVVKRV